MLRKWKANAPIRTAKSIARYLGLPHRGVEFVIDRTPQHVQFTVITTFSAERSYQRQAWRNPDRTLTDNLAAALVKAYTAYTLTDEMRSQAVRAALREEHNAQSFKDRVYQRASSGFVYREACSCGSGRVKCDDCGGQRTVIKTEVTERPCAKCGTRGILSDLHKQKWHSLSDK
jgi:ribosomal protein S27E